MTTDAQSTSSGLKFAVGGAGVAIPASAAHTSVTSATPAAFSLGVVQDQSLGLPSSRIYSITNGPTQNNSSIISSSQAGKVYPTQQQQQRPISFDPSVFNRRHSQSQQIPRHHDVLTNNNLPLASLEPSSLSSSFTGELMQQMRNYDDEDSTSDSSDSSDSDNDEGQVFRTSVSIQVPASQSAGTMSSTAKTANKSKPRRPSSSPQRRRESTPTPPKDPSSIPSAAASPRSNVGPNTAPTSHTPASSSTAATTPLDPDAIRSPTTRTLKRDSVGIARKPSYQSLSRSSVGGSPYAASGAGSGSVPLGGSVGVAARNPARNVSFGDVASFLRQQTANSAGGSVVSSSSFVADSSRGSVAAAAAAAAAAAGGFAGSWKLGSSFGSFKRNLSGVSIKRKDSIVSTHSIGGFSNQSGSFVAPSPAMSYLSMLAENLAEPPRGVYYEGDQIGDWVLGKEIGHGSFSRVFQASPAAESELTEHLSLSTKVAIKIVAKALPAPSTTTPMQSAHGSEVSLVGSTGTTSQRSSISGRDECGAGADDVRRLLDHEIAVWSGLDHPNILGMVQMMDVDDAVFIVSELAEGGTLLDYLGKRGRVKENVAKRMFKQVAEAVRYLHCIAMVVHRDIKCENILIMEAAPPESSSSALSTSSSASSLNSPYWGSAWGGGSNSQQEAPAPTPISQPADWIPTVKLADFGLSERLTNSATSVDPLPTTTGSLVNSDPIFCIGSLHYCAPEELKTTIVASPAGDMWSLGCVFYTMLTASLPFNDEFLPRLQQSIMTGRYDEAKLARAGVSDAGRSMIQGLLNVNPETRLTIQEVCEHEYFSHC
ncbi:kinase-like domain-containing protein [Chytriomyces sp. MP71]|nr:kinase-like domain-containing protein [Chytriomyces sp. MP71]